MESSEVTPYDLGKVVLNDLGTMAKCGLGLVDSKAVWPFSKSDSTDVTPEEHAVQSANHILHSYQLRPQGHASKTLLFHK